MHIIKKYCSALSRYISVPLLDILVYLSGYISVSLSVYNIMGDLNETKEVLAESKRKNSLEV